MAGTGKSTISRTIARQFSKTGHLGATFFFKRGEGDRGNTNMFFSTLARDLASKRPSISSHLGQSIDDEPGIIQKGLIPQFEKLILKPLQAARETGGEVETTIMIIDALDECDSDDRAKQIINLMPRAKSIGLKVFLTSRPELPIRLGFNSIAGTYTHLILHQIPEHIVEADIALYLNHEMAYIRKEYNNSVSMERKLPDIWPSEFKAQQLVKMAIPLFIFAATICRFLCDRRCGSPDMQLQQVLKFQTRSQYSQLDATYLPILYRLMDGLSVAQQNQLSERFRKVIGAIVILESPLSATTLREILGLPQDVIDNQLDLLHSVLDIPDSVDAPIRLFHLSFRDFLLNSEMAKDESTKPFWVDGEKTHKEMADQCLGLLKRHLRYNMGGIMSPGTSLEEIPPAQRTRYLPKAAQYACVYWVEHLISAGTQISSSEDEYAQFLDIHLLHWIEALIYLDRTARSLPLIEKLLFLTPYAADTFVLLQDTLRFLRENLTVISNHPLQIYALIAFVPKSSKLRELYASCVPDFLQNRPLVRENWRDDRQVIELDDGSMYNVTFSPDDSYLFTTSEDETIRFWNVNTAECGSEFEGHTARIACVKLSLDSMFLVSASDDSTIRIWDAITGECLHILSERIGIISDLEISFDSQFLVSCSAQYAEMRVWSIRTGQCMHVLESPDDPPASIKLVPASYTLISGHEKRNVRVWDIETGDILHNLDNFGDTVAVAPNSHLAVAIRPQCCSLWNIDTASCISLPHQQVQVPGFVTFSPNSQLVLTVSFGICYFWIWSASTGELIKEITLEPEREDDDSYDGSFGLRFDCAAFSYDSRLIATGCNDGTIYLCESETGNLVKVLKGHTGYLHSLGFSHNNALLASTSRDGSIRVWDFVLGESTDESEHIPVQSVILSPDSQFMIARLEDFTTQLWEVKTGKHLYSLELGGMRHADVLFSPDSSLLLVVNPATIISTISARAVPSGDTKYELDTIGVGNIRAAFSNDSSQLATMLGGEDFTIRYAETAEVRAVCHGNSNAVRSMEFSLDGSLLVSASGSLGNRSVQIWSCSTGSQIHMLPWKDIGVQYNYRGKMLTYTPDSVKMMKFTPDQAMIAIVTEGGTIELWDVATGSLIRVLSIHSKAEQGMPTYLHSVDFSACKSLLTTASNRDLRIWGVESGKCTHILKGDVRDSWVRFGEDDGSLITRTATYDIKASTLESSDLELPQISNMFDHIQYYSMDADGGWIMWNRKKLLWIPNEFRPSDFEIRDSLIAIGCSSGAVIFIQLASSNIP